MTRITKSLAIAIADRAVEKAGLVVDRQPRYALAEKLRIESLGGPARAKKVEQAIKRVEKTLSEMPDGLVQRDPFRKSFQMYRMNLGGRRVNLEFSQDLEVDKVCPAGFTLPGDHPLVAEFDDVIAAEEQVQSQIDALRQKVRATVSSFTTLAKLVDAWPEVVELLPENAPAPAVGLPAVRTEELNAAIGLPSKGLQP